MNATAYSTKNHENQPLRSLPEPKPNQTDACITPDAPLTTMISSTFLLQFPPGFRNSVSAARLFYAVQSFSISSRLLPFVSGTKTQTKTTSTAHRAPYTHKGKP